MHRFLCLSSTYVITRNVETTANLNKKLIPKFKGSYVVKEAIYNDGYVVNIDEFQLTVAYKYTAVYHEENTWVFINTRPSSVFTYEREEGKEGERENKVENTKVDTLVDLGEFKSSVWPFFLYLRTGFKIDLVVAVCYRNSNE